MNLESPLPLTLEEHRELGKEMRTAGARLQELCILVVKIYGAQNPAARRFLEVTEAIEDLKHELEAQAERDWPDQPAEGIYT
jgi:hypothetical protein